MFAWAKAAEALRFWHDARSAVPTCGSAHFRQRGHGGPRCFASIEVSPPPLPTPQANVQLQRLKREGLMKTSLRYAAKPPQRPGFRVNHRPRSKTLFWVGIRAVDF